MSPDPTFLLLYALGFARHSFKHPPLSTMDENHVLSFTEDSYQLNPKMVRMLLEHGADPYKLYNNAPIWESFLAETKDRSLGRDTDWDLIKCSDILQTFLHYGSQRTVGTSSIYENLLNSLSLSLLIHDVFSMRLPREAYALRRACDLFRTRKRRRTRSDKSSVSTSPR
jgi:hypothetical protein